MPQDVIDDLTCFADFFGREKEMITIAEGIILAPVDKIGNVNQKYQIFYDNEIYSPTNGCSECECISGSCLHACVYQLTIKDGNGSEKWPQETARKTAKSGLVRKDGRQIKWRK